LKKKAKYNINVVTMGCSKNLVDSERLMGQFDQGSYELIHNGEGYAYDAVVINTCGFIHDAKEESIATILDYTDAKKRGDIGSLYVMGCLSERYKDDLRKEIPEVDAYFGVNDLVDVLKSLSHDPMRELTGERKLTTPTHYAYMKISEGCDRKCSFCAIPGIRGGHVSKPMEDLLKEAEILSAGGVKELILIAQDLTWYGIDIYKRRELNTLLKALTHIQGINWIRLHYAYPASFPMKVLDTMAKSDKICNYIDIPLQHISYRILRSMRRGHSAEASRKLVKIIREKVPGVAIRTSFISGYPGETVQEHNQLKEFIKAERFERLGVFTYSHEEDTPAYRLRDNISPETKQERMAELMDIQQDISFEINSGKIGSTQKVLIDREEGDYYVGRTQYDSPEVDNEVLVGKAGEDLVLGNFYDIEINKAEAFDLMGSIKKDDTFKEMPSFLMRL
jgi:ribosomal protein S12 methylthiotransferase